MADNRERKVDLGLAGKVAIVTGAGGGIGRAIALRLAEAGAHIAVVDRIGERCEEVADRLTELEVASIPCVGDVVEADFISEVMEKTYARFNRIDILVNNAGGVSRRGFLDQHAGNWRKLIDLNLGSVFSATAAAVPYMIKGEAGGAIVNVTSIEASRAAPNFAVYGACKAGVENFTRSAALEFAEHNIRVNAIAPDYTVTPGTRGNIRGPVDPDQWVQPDAAHYEAVARRIPLGRPGIDTECGDAAAFLCSDMSRYVTGIVMPVDGGTWASSGWMRNTKGEWTLDGRG